MAGPLIVTAELGKADFAWANGLRSRHFPPERNQVPTHLTLFHALPPSSEGEVRRAIKRACAAPPPGAEIAGLMSLGGGVAFRIRSAELDAVREELASAFHGLLTAQDSGGWAPHITIQNKVEPAAARELMTSLERSFEPRPLSIRGLLLFRYLGGPWEPLGNWQFRGVS
ncbi:2'-5' RNA ligase family protein [Sphingomonas sinipercae]|uniref:2'-5' RNA ligase family protein n=1 Tax=Sphingomonas sinipercae TaxID=2714944 RepID=A0A6G7ZNR6_9SPHN|nr:2'-5' RNA ligase family protein [Sphingomonas sinipercae]QIL02546.1 2'-5' RNA ligase family protein [Sphingomonas sinipercae]